MAINWSVLARISFFGKVGNLKVAHKMACGEIKNTGLNLGSGCSGED